jgi:hypothetical protein
MGHVLTHVKGDVGVSFKTSGKWNRSTQDWIKDQGSDPVVEYKIVADGKVLEGYRNLKTRQIFLTRLRKATLADEMGEATRNFMKRKRQKPIYVNLEEVEGLFKDE